MKKHFSIFSIILAFALACSPLGIDAQGALGRAVRGLSKAAKKVKVIKPVARTAKKAGKPNVARGVYMGSKVVKPSQKYTCPSCKGYGYFKYQGNVYTCKNCGGRGYIYK